MAKPDPVSASDLFALDLAVKSERSGTAIEQIAKPGCSAEVIAAAEQLCALLSWMRHEAHDCAAEQGIARDEVDAMFDQIVANVLGSRGRVH